MSQTQQDIIADLPSHLRPFVKVQDYARYSARDQAVWRFVLKHLARHLQVCAHPVYLEGLARTGISLDHIPSVDEMNACLAQLGWRAVVVDGFVPPAIFMEFQALKILVIALDMRSIDQINYTPAPDIVHESAGHAPFIVDVDYAEFLQRFGEIGMKAIASRHDFALYEAIRRLSVVKSCPESSAESIAQAERELQDLSEQKAELSEASLLSRLHWWTVEYGLVGEPDNYKIFGAGLLSSLGESVHCLNDQHVKKIPLTVDAVTCAYDITCLQPQLFVTKSCRHLSQVLEEFAATMSFTRGGRESLLKAVDAGTVCSAQYDSGMQVSGIFAEVLADSVGNAIYLRTAGPTQLAWHDMEIYGHGTDYHAEGFGSPIGRLKDFSRCLSYYSIDELKAHDIVIGERVVLEFLSGITVRGCLREIQRRAQRNLILSFTDCTVTDLAGRVLFDPAWGSYDMAVGASIVSVFGGTADRSKYRLYEALPAASPSPGVEDKALMAVYSLVEALRHSGEELDARRRGELQQGLLDYPQEWLLRTELLALPRGLDNAVRVQLAQELGAIQASEPTAAPLIEMALETLASAA